MYRLWFVCNTGSSRSTLQSTVPTEIGYMNVIPKCISSLSKYPHYENLPETYVAINDYLVESPLEGYVNSFTAAVSPGLWYIPGTYQVRPHLIRKVGADEASTAQRTVSP